MFYFEIRNKYDLRNNLFLKRFKHYKSALNYLKSQCKYKIKNDFFNVLADNSVMVIRDYLNRIICNCNYDKENKCYTIIETDNIGLNEVKTIINQ